MAPTFPLERERAASAASSRERRDVTTRALRNAVAAWFRIHPATLATLDPPTVERMAMRLEGRRQHRSLDGLDGVCPVPEGRHPWAG
ncbi:MAG: hypothetical protein QOE72_1064 [Chloroflexota bacterium]|jgi:hypothetical protein|nr:hypothetical protein [Chloroflexota bacterium]